jgi:hypothetical protein
MTTFIMRLSRSPAFDLGRLAQGWETFAEAWREAQAMARAAQARYPFTVE